jgi:CTP:molybdopterin cytidylyltransferase MocA
VLGHVLLKLGGARAAGLIGLTVVVHNPADDAIRALAAEYRCHAEAMRNNTGDLSMSLRTGLDAIKRRSATDQQQGLLICLGDQPMLRLDVIKALIETWGRGGIAAVRPAYREAPDEPGHPLLLDRSLWHLADELRGDTGFGPVLDRHRVNVKTVPVAGRNPDVDTREDLQRLEGVASPVPA